MCREILGDLKTDSLISPGDQGDGFVLHRDLLCLPIGCRRRLAVITWLKRNSVPHLYGTCSVCQGGHGERQTGRPSDGLEPRGRTDRRVRADASATSTRCSSRPRRCSRPLEWTLRCERLPRRPASASAPFTGTFPNARTSSQLSSVVKSMLARRPPALRCGAQARRGAGEMVAAIRRLYCNQTRACPGAALGKPGLRNLARLLRAATPARTSDASAVRGSAGEVRNDVEPDELLGAVASLCMPAHDDGHARRMVALLVDGLRFGANPRSSCCERGPIGV